MHKLKKNPSLIFFLNYIKRLLITFKSFNIQKMEPKHTKAAVD